MGSLSPEVEQQLANMSAGEWAALTAKVRAPDDVEALRTAASQLLTGDALNAFTAAADVSKFVGADGKVDAHRVLANIRATFGGSDTRVITNGRDSNHGQSSGGNGQEAPRARPGDGGRIAAAKRLGAPLDEQTAAAAAMNRGTGPGSAGSAAAAKRFGQPNDNMAGYQAAGAKR